MYVQIPSFWHSLTIEKRPLDNILHIIGHIHMKRVCPGKVHVLGMHCVLTWSDVSLIMAVLIQSCYCEANNIREGRRTYYWYNLDYTIYESK